MPAHKRPRPPYRRRGHTRLGGLDRKKVLALRSRIPDQEGDFAAEDDEIRSLEPAPASREVDIISPPADEVLEGELISSPADELERCARMLEGAALQIRSGRPISVHLGWRRAFRANGDVLGLFATVPAGSLPCSEPTCPECRDRR